MYSYNIYADANHAQFICTCSAIENAVQISTKEKLLIDVDGSEIQIYHTPHGEIRVFNDYEVGAVYVDSDFELNELL